MKWLVLLYFNSSASWAVCQAAVTWWYTSNGTEQLWSRRAGAVCHWLVKTLVWRLWPHHWWGIWEKSVKTRVSSHCCHLRKADFNLKTTPVTGPNHSKFKNKSMKTRKSLKVKGESVERFIWFIYRPAIRCLINMVRYCKYVKIFVN